MQNHCKSDKNKANNEEDFDFSSFLTTAEFFNGWYNDESFKSFDNQSHNQPSTLTSIKNTANLDGKYRSSF